MREPCVGNDTSPLLNRLVYARLAGLVSSTQLHEAGSQRELFESWTMFWSGAPGYRKLAGAA